MLTRHFWMMVHRYTGLAMACFLILVALIGSLLAFSIEINHRISPRFYARPQPGAAPLGFATFVERAEALVPQGQVYWIQIADRDQIDVRLSPCRNPATGKPYRLAVDDLYLNPWTAQELARRKPGEPYPTAFVDTQGYHGELCLGNFGFRFMGITALIWTIDCFSGFYLSLPATLQRFWPRWRQAWLVKSSASAAPVNFDLYRAGGLWRWPRLFVFAWSGVMFNLPEVYKGVSSAVFHDRWPQADAEMPMPATGNERPPRLDLQAALSNAERYRLPEDGEMPMPGTGAERPPRLDLHALSTTQHLMAEQATIHCPSVGERTAFAYLSDNRTHFYNVKSSRDISDSDSFTTVTFDGDTGAPRSVHIPTGEHNGDTVSLWLLYLHEAGMFGLPYHIFVCVLGSSCSPTPACTSGGERGRAEFLQPVNSRPRSRRPSSSPGARHYDP